MEYSVLSIGILRPQIHPACQHPSNPASHISSHIPASAQELHRSTSIVVHAIPSCGVNSSTFSELIRYFRTVPEKFLICSLKVDELTPHEGILYNRANRRLNLAP